MRRRGTISVSLATAGLLAFLPHLLAPLDQPRRTFVSLRYLVSARQRLTRRPMDRPGAARDIKRALAVAPTDKLILSQAGDILMLAEDYQAAAQIFARTDLTGPDEMISFAHCLLMSDSPDEGEKLLLSVVARVERLRRLNRLSSGHYALLMNNAAYALAEANRRLTAAKRMAEIAVDFAPLQPAFCDTLGWTLLKLRELDEARFYLERAVRQALPSPDPVVLYHLGCIYGKLNNRAEARRFLLWSLAADPSREDAARALRHLYRTLPVPALARVNKDRES